MNKWQSFQQAFTRLGSQEHGVAMIYFALILPMLIAMGGLALDGSNLYMQQRHVQVAADSAALAAARLVAMGQTTTQINAEMQNLATTNGAQSYTWSYIQSNTGVQVNATKTFPAYFAGSLGYPDAECTRHGLRSLLFHHRRQQPIADDDQMPNRWLRLWRPLPAVGRR